MPELYLLKHGHASALYEPLENSDVYVNSNDPTDKISLGFIEKNRLGNFVGGFDVTGVKVPDPRFIELSSVTPEMFRIVPDADLFNILNVPLYKTHGDTRKNGHVSDAAFLDRMVRNHYTTKEATKHLFGTDAFAWLPKFHLGHTPNNPDLPERECIAFIDNLYRVGDFLFGDIQGLSKNDLQLITSGRYPDRSAEVDIKRARLLSVAALGFRTPHFGLPQMNPRRMRSQYEKLVQKHLFSDVIHMTFRKEDFPMPKGKSKNSKAEVKGLSAVDAAKFFALTQTDSEFNEAFESAKDEAIAKYMGLSGGMMPMGPDLGQIIQQIMTQMMMQKMNPGMGGGGMGAGADPNGNGGGYQNNASDVLDFESIMHNVTSEEFDFDEEGTGEAGPDDFGLRKGSTKGDHPVDKTVGTPSTSDNSSDDDTKIIDSTGDVTERSLLQAQDVVKNAIKKIPEKSRSEVEGVFKGMLNLVDELSKHVQAQGEALKNLNSANEQNKKNARRTRYQSALEACFKEGNAAVNSKEKIKNHLDLLMSLPEDAAEKYMANIKDTPSLTERNGTQRFGKGDLVGPEKSESFIEKSRAEYNEECPRELRKYVDPDAFALTDIWSKLG